MILPATFFVLVFPTALGTAKNEAVQVGISILALAILASSFLKKEKNDNIEKLLKFVVVPIAGTCLLLGRKPDQEELHLDMASVLSAAAIL